jgi:hypothetical protein
VATLAGERELSQVPSGTDGTRRRPRGNKRLALALVALAALLLAIAIAVGPGSGSAGPGPATGAAALVPADALAYVNVSTDPSRPAVKQALALARRFGDFPLGAAAIQTRLAAIVGGGGAGVSAAEIRPWLGKEVALALLNTSGATAGSLIVLELRDAGRARSFLTGAGAKPVGNDGAVQLLGYPTGTELAFLGRYLVLGQDASVRAAIAVATDGAPSLASDPTYRSAAAGEPAGRVLDAYVSADGVHRLLEVQHGVFGALGTLLDQPALSGATISLSPASGGAVVRVHSALDTHVGAVRFDPTLERVLPAGSTMMLDVADLGAVAPRLLSAAADVGVAGGVGPLFSRLGPALAAEGVDLKGVLSLFKGETAVALVPTSGGSGTPAVTVVARTADPAQATSELGALEAPLEQLFPAPSSGSGEVPLSGGQTIDGVQVTQVSLAPGLQVDYAVSGGLLMISTSVQAIGEIVRRDRSLASDPGYRAALGGSPGQVTSLLYVDFNQLLSLGEQTGLVHSSTYQAISGDLAKIRAVGVSSTRGESDSTAELFLQIL